jgi:hypothetical protein
VTRYGDTLVILNHTLRSSPTRRDVAAGVDAGEESDRRKPKDEADHLQGHAGGASFGITAIRRPDDASMTRLSGPSPRTSA